MGEWYHDLNAIAAGFVGPSEERYAVSCGGAAREVLVDIVASALIDCVSDIAREIGGTHAAAFGR